MMSDGHDHHLIRAINEHKIVGKSFEQHATNVQSLRHSRIGRGWGVALSEQSDCGTQLGFKVETKSWTLGKIPVSSGFSLFARGGVESN